MPTPSKLIKTPYDELTYKIIGCAMAVHGKLGPGYRKNTYQRDLAVYPDFVVEGQVIVELKALKFVDTSHEAQVIGYLAVSGCSVGLLLNFGLRSLQKKRILPLKSLAEHRVNRQWLFVPDWLRSEPPKL